MRILAAALLAIAAPAAAQDLRLGIPVDCTLGEDCHIQQFVDRDPGPGARDFTCGPLSYDGHNGTDFAVPTLADMRRGVAVIAAAPGVVRGVRDGVGDRIYSDANAEQVDGIECGNGVAIRHEGGWETQYCHLRNGSVQVAQGDRVERGTVLGMIGLSGKTQFPHLHLSVRRDGTRIDPFDTTATESCGAGGDTLCDHVPPYQPGAVMLAGFAPSVPDYQDIQAGTVRHDTLAPDAPGLVLWGFAYGGRAGDVLQLEIDGPDGPFFRNEMREERNRARFFRASGRRLRDDRWPAGTYTGTVTLLRDGRRISQRIVEMTIP